MKHLYLLTTTTLFFLFINLNAQVTITFDTNGYTDNQNLGTTETIDGYVFTGSNGGLPQDLIVDADGAPSGLGLVPSLQDFADGDLLTITQSGGGNFQAVSFAFASNFTSGIVAEAFVGGISQGTQTLNSPGASGTFNFDTTFDNVDEIRITGTGGFGLFLTIDDFMFDASVLDISTYSLIDEFTTYPNPTNGDITLKFDKNQEYLAIKIMTATGTIIESKSIHNSNLIQLNLNYPSGIYIVEITDNKAKKSVVKVLKK